MDTEALAKAVPKFLVHVEMPGAFSVYVIAVPDRPGVRFQFYPPKDNGGAQSSEFEAYLGSRFGQLGDPSETVFRSEINCYDVLFQDLVLKNGEEALALIAGA